MPLRALAAALAAIVFVGLSAAPAVAKWLRSSDPSDSVGATLRVDDSPRVIDDGWQVVWTIQLTCPEGSLIEGRVLVAERDPASIPQLAGEDQGITATAELQGTEECTGHRQVLRLVLDVVDTVVFDPTTGQMLTFHEPISVTPADRTSAAVQLFSPEGTTEGSFFVQYCAAPNCASESGPRVTLR
jgi:hypothetical protein